MKTRREFGTAAHALGGQLQPAPGTKISIGELSCVERPSGSLCTPPAELQTNEADKNEAIY
jgi:hypothetical protein